MRLGARKGSNLNYVVYFFTGRGPEEKPLDLIGYSPNDDLFAAGGNHDLNGVPAL